MFERAKNKKILNNQIVNIPGLCSWPGCVMSIGLILLTNQRCEDRKLWVNLETFLWRNVTYSFGPSNIKNLLLPYPILVARSIQSLRKARFTQMSNCLLTLLSV